MASNSRAAVDGGQARMTAPKAWPLTANRDPCLASRVTGARRRMSMASGKCAVQRSDKFTRGISRSLAFAGPPRLSPSTRQNVRAQAARKAVAEGKEVEVRVDLGGR